MAGPDGRLGSLTNQGRLMKTLLCLLIATVVGTVLQHAGIPHGLLLGSILATAVIASRFRFSPTLRFSLGYVQIVLGIATGLMFTGVG